MADDESEGDPGSNDSRQPNTFVEKETTHHARVSLPAQNRREIWNTGASPSPGPRSLFLKRTENGFGFTLRHFIVYPPESNAILARDRRLGLDVRAVGNEPMDTIFVKNVRENSPASLAGLTNGDRIISVNGEDIAGLSYARVIQLIHKTGNYLHLLVVPKENDILQLYFSETAHNPETNQRLRVHSPEAAPNAHSKKNCVNAKVTSMHHYSRCQTSPLQIGSSSAERSRIISPVRSIGVRRCSEGSTERKLEPSANLYPRGIRDLCPPQTISDTSSCCSSESGQTYGFGSNAPAARYSLDVSIGHGNNYDSLSDSSVKDSYGSEDSLIMSRLRKSFEQKEEFMNRMPQSGIISSKENTATSKEFYSRPQKLMTPMWPPSQSNNSYSNWKGENNMVQETSNKARNKQNFISTLDKIQENTSLVPNLTKLRETGDVAAQPFQVVSARTKQFENGPIDNKTELYRSELARLSTKLNATNVATRKRDFEYRAQVERQGFAARETRSLESANIPFYSTPNSGNRIIPIGSKNLHCEPPSDFSQLSTKTDVTRKSDSEENADHENSTDTLSQLKQLADPEDDKITRRISYIRATTGDAMNIDSECEISDSEVIVSAPQRSILGSRKTTDNFPEQDQHSIIKEGAVLCKVTQVDGKRAGDRSWKPIWLILKGPFLCLYKDKKESLPVHSETPATFDRSDLGASCDRIDIRCSVVEVASDYTKRKHVFRLNAPSVGAEILLQADDANSMTQWVKVLREQASVISTTNEPLTSFSSNVSPSTGNKTLRKLTSLRNRSPTGDSPSTKTRKSIQAEAQQTSPKSRNWKNKMAKQLRRIQPGSGSLNAPSVVTYPPGATIGIPLEVCPSSSFSEYVPLLVEICTNIVEAKGLEIIGIYRVPGNTAAVTSLTEAVNRGLEVTILDQDPRWSDVNVISSLLKSFFRKLPDALLTAELYPHFIKADRIEDPVLRMVTIRKLVHNLPDHNFETLRYLLFHLKKVVANSSVNKMEARNLAIVFGPTLVRNGDDMVTMVTDMSHQCRIVESLLCYVDWCFGDGNLAELKASIPAMNSGPELEASTSHSLLLSNIRKLDGATQSATAKDLVSTIIGAANRKMQKTSKHLTSTRKSNTSTICVTNSSSTSEEIFNSSQSNQNSSSETKNVDRKVDENKSISNQPVDEESPDHVIPNSVTMIKQMSEDLSSNGNEINTDGNTWTYAGLSATTQERIRRFEQETKAMLQRELSRQKRLSNFTPEELEKEKSSMKNNDSCSEKHPENTQRSLISDKVFDESCKSDQTTLLNDNSICDNPPPVVVMRRNLPSVNGKNVTTNNNNNNNNHLKRLKTGDEFVRNNSIERSGSLDSLHRVGRPSSHVSDDGGDLLMSLTTTFDRKLRSLTEEKGKKLTIDCLATKKRNSFSGHPEIEDNSLFRDPSLHRTFEKNSKTIGAQNDDTELNKENDKNCETGTDNVKDLRSCVTCGCSMKHTEAIQQNCDNWKRTVLQETHSDNRLQENVKCESKLFYSNSVKLRRSESLKEGTSNAKLRRSGSLNKHEPKISRVETWMLTRNAEAIKLKRTDSLTKSEKTETNMMKRRQMEMNKKNRSDKDSKMKRRNGTSKNGNIKRRHTVGGTKDFDKVSWLQNQQRDTNKENRKERRTSSPDLSSTKMTDFLIEVVVRPRSFISADPNFISRLLNIPLESHV